VKFTKGMVGDIQAVQCLEDCKWSTVAWTSWYWYSCLSKKYVGLFTIEIMNICIKNEGL